MRLARYFGTSADVWLRLQVRYDLEVVERDFCDRIQREVKVLQHGDIPRKNDIYVMVLNHLWQSKLLNRKGEASGK